jgi:hypothetical protein
MTIDELEKEFENILQHSPDCEDSEFLRAQMPKLIKLARAVFDDQKVLRQCGFLTITRALEEIEI